METFSAKTKLFLVLQCAATAVFAGNLSESHISVDLTQLERDSGKSVVYLNDNGTTINNRSDDTPVASTGSFNDTADIGYRLSGSKKLIDNWSINFQLFNNSMSKSQSFLSPNERFEIIYGGTNEFDSARTVQSTYDSDVMTEEINAVYKKNDNLDFLFGIGHINLEETMSIVSDDVGTGGVGTYKINTENSMLGVHTGVSIDYKATDNVDLYFVGKIGVYDNKAKQTQTFRDTSAADIDTSGSTKETSNLIDVRLGLNYSFTSKLVMNVGYQSYKISNVALAESHFKDTLSAINSNAVNGKDDITWSGFNLGLNYRF